MDRQEALARRIHAQQLDRAPADRPLTDAAVLDLGVQDSGRDGASWALANRGVPAASAAAVEQAPELALAWTVRAAPHYYRRDDLPDVAVATSPFSDADAAKRVVGAAAPLAAAGTGAREGLAEMAATLRAVVEEPLVKGEVSRRLTAVLPERHLRDCVPCGARHAWEVPFRLGALYAGLELVPGTSPPVLKRIEPWPRSTWGPADDPAAAPPRLQVVRSYLRLLGPATPPEVAAFLDSTVAEVKQHWPDDAVAVEVDGRRAWVLPDDEGDTAAAPADLVRLLGPFDLLLQGRDRSLLVPDRGRHKALWPTLGRPGAVLVGTDVVGTWRPRASGAKLALRLELWQPLPPAARARVDEEAERLAAHRGLRLAGVETP
ncbi:Winged helix DNA-binding domain-containing protein [Friedmanniella luteola]|uniref:Winged helix DNA-binding domain-containing protein n=1 Tax=Friedmanniella luteola TaxID=546871 RepID=A0A1H1ZZG9_9ACTN|nr:winged helix DNA-binding domain-containing protein [Friedmanniella luteola]SDT38937.1 Winged helix DNA-binding domain-containing protein [Friedmanniella luteola]